MLNTDFWNKYFRVYDALNFVIPYQELLAEVAKKTMVRKGDLILDAGSGTGNLAILLKKQGGRVVALDYSKEALEIHLEKDKKAVVVQHDLAKKLNFPDNYFDKIVSINALFNLDREARKETTKEFYRAIKPHGKIILVNLLNGFNPFKIYLDHFKKSKKQKGIILSIIELLKFTITSLNILYYANKIKKNGDQKNALFDHDEQKELLRNAGFKDISENKSVYSDQAILNSALK